MLPGATCREGVGWTVIAPPAPSFALARLLDGWLASVARLTPAVRGSGLIGISQL